METTSCSGPKYWGAKNTNSDPLLSILPLRGDVSRALAAELIRDGAGKFCGHCEKPFNSARKWRGVARVNHVAPAGGFVSTAWLICGRCVAEMRAHGNRVSGKLINEARAAADAGQLILTPAQGSA